MFRVPLPIFRWVSSMPARNGRNTAFGFLVEVDPHTSTRAAVCAQEIAEAIRKLQTLAVAALGGIVVTAALWWPLGPWAAIWGMAGAVAGLALHRLPWARRRLELYGHECEAAAAASLYGQHRGAYRNSEARMMVESPSYSFGSWGADDIERGMIRNSAAADKFIAANLTWLRRLKE